MQYHGQAGLSLKVVAAYCPHTKGGDLLVNRQQCYWFHITETPQIPHKSFWEGLTTEINQWIANGDQLVVVGNWNKPVQQVEEKDLAKQELQEVLIKWHGSRPATFEFRSNTIDSIL